MSYSPFAHESIEALRTHLLNGTLAHAVSHSAFYARLYDKIDVTHIVEPADLARLPTIAKADLLAAGTAALCRPEGVRLASLQNTSGTTGHPFQIYRSFDELEFLSQFFLEARKAAQSGEAATHPLTLLFSNTRHGSPIGIPSESLGIFRQLSDPNSLPQIVELLRTTFDVPGYEHRISGISGAVDDLLALTAYLIESELEPTRAFAIRRLLVTGRYLTRRWRQLMEDLWHVVAIDRYSLAEAVGGATWDAERRGYVFDPWVIPEVLDLHTGAPLLQGVGRLHLTCLHPFVIMQPLIRYRTGDLFDIAPTDGRNSVMRYHGREAQALFHPESPDKLLVTEVDVLEAIDAHSEFRRWPGAVELGLKDSTATQHPIMQGTWRREHGCYVFQLCAETQQTLQLYPGREKELRICVANDIMRTSPALKELVDRGFARFELRLVPPRTLTHRDRLWTAADGSAPLE